MENWFGVSFSVRTCYEQMANADKVLGPRKSVWYNVVPLKVQFFMWTTTLQKISTKDMLQRKGFASQCMPLMLSGRCTSYLLIHCPFSWDIWNGIIKDFGATFITPSSLSQLLQRWNVSIHSPWEKGLEVGSRHGLLGNLEVEEQSCIQILFQTGFSSV